MSMIEVEHLVETVTTGDVDSAHKAWRKLGKLNLDVPALLLQRYRRSRTWKERIACVFYSTPFVRDFRSSAVKLGIEALSDKSQRVTFRACKLLAYAQDPETIPPLKALATANRSDEERANAEAAIDAIENQNQHYFLDRDHSELTFMWLSVDEKKQSEKNGKLRN